MKVVDEALGSSVVGDAEFIGKIRRVFKVKLRILEKTEVTGDGQLRGQQNISIDWKYLFCFSRYAWSYQTLKTDHMKYEPAIGRTIRKLQGN